MPQKGALLQPLFYRGTCCGKAWILLKILQLTTRKNEGTRTFLSGRILNDPLADKMSALPSRLHAHYFFSSTTSASMIGPSSLPPAFPPPCEDSVCVPPPVEP